MDLGSNKAHAGASTSHRDMLTWQATEYELFTYYRLVIAHIQYDITPEDGIG